MHDINKSNKQQKLQQKNHYGQPDKMAFQLKIQ